MRSLPCGVALLLTIGAPPAVMAEEMVPASVVLELFKVAPRFHADEVAITVGAAPGQLVEELGLPEDLEVAAGFSWIEGASVVAVSELPKPLILGRIEAALNERSWKRYRPTASATGFQPSEDDTGAVFCHDQGGTVGVTADPKGEDETIVRLKHDRGRGFSSCDRMARHNRNLESIFEGEVPFPTLYPPAGAKSRGGGSSGSGEFERSASTSLETELSSADVLTHYATQMSQQNWQPDAAVEYDALAYQSWLHVDETGRRWHALLLAKIDPRDEDRRRVELDVSYLGRS